MPDIVEAQGFAAGTLGPTGLDRSEILGRRVLDRQLSQAQVPPQRLTDELGARTVLARSGFVSRPEHRLGQ
jgi:hypothetical protein